MAKYDAEDMLDDVLAVMTANLNTKISAIEAEKIAKGKGLTPTLSTVDSGSYFRQSWNENILNKNPAIYYGIEDQRSLQSEGPATVIEYKVFCEVILVDSGQTNDASRRIARYTRALQEIFQEFFAQAAEMGKIKIETVRPNSFKLDLNSSEEMKVGGVLLTISLA